MSNTTPEFIATYWTHAGNVVPLGAPADEASPHDFRKRAEAAAASGYCGIGLIHSDLVAIQRQYSLAEIKTILADCGLRHLEFEFVVGWLEAGEAKAAADAMMRDLVDAAAVLGARHIKVGPDMSNKAWPLGHMTECFADLCTTAATVDCGVVLEIMPWSNLATVASGVEVVAGAGCSNGGLLIDVWHVVRGGNSFSTLETIPAGLIHHVEINDADSEPVGSLLQDTVNRRRHCGHGVFDLPAFIRALDRQGYAGPVGIEILSDYERQRPFAAVLDDAIIAARQQYTLARS